MDSTDKQQKLERWPRQPSYTREELLTSGTDGIFGPGNAKLPTPNMLMFDRIINIDDTGGRFAKGEMWQIVGFWLAWAGSDGRGRALGVGDVKFQGQVLRESKLVRYRVEMKRVIKRKLVMGLGDGTMDVDGRTIYHAKNLRVGLFTSTEGF